MEMGSITSLLLISVAYSLRELAGTRPQGSRTKHGSEERVFQNSTEEDSKVCSGSRKRKEAAVSNRSQTLEKSLLKRAVLPGAELGSETYRSIQKACGYASDIDQFLLRLHNNMSDF